MTILEEAIESKLDELNTALRLSEGDDAETQIFTTLRTSVHHLAATYREEAAQGKNQKKLAEDFRFDVRATGLRLRRN